VIRKLGAAKRHTLQPNGSSMSPVANNT